MPDTAPSGFDLDTFLPYLLNQAAEAASRSFQPVYRDGWGMTRPQWRVLAHVGRSGGMTARDICRASQMEKTMVSRAVAALESRGWLIRARAESDRRAENLTLTAEGRAVFAGLGRRACDHDRSLRQALGADATTLETVLRRLIREAPPPGDTEGDAP
ncbi:MAG: winged helix-turn-helix transcriptional regulator [Paracoccaceae bacterium]|nr:MAG: winged helix-turn-helix transcriptional regulator [Paracoccaceae bacterium]